MFDGLYCRRCPPNAIGLYGDCKCIGQGTYLKEINRCRSCPEKRLFQNEYFFVNFLNLNRLNSPISIHLQSIGKYPNCVCEESLFYDIEKNECVGCPEGTTGLFPNCHCHNETAVFVPPWRSCRECPENSTGYYKTI